MTRGALDIRQVSKSFCGVRALDDFSCYIERGELVGLIGPNGAGKTTLFNAVTRLVELDSGAIACNGTNIASVARASVVRTGVARTFQDMRLIRRLAAIENVLLCFQEQPRESLWRAIIHGGSSDRHEARITEKGLDLLENVGLRSVCMRKASELSYGQQKLLAFACCLATGSGTMLLDEPIAGVAPGIKKQILSLITQLNSKGKTIVLIEHDVEAVWEICGRVIFMDEGRLIADGSPEYVRNDRHVLERYVR